MAAAPKMTEGNEDDCSTEDDSTHRTTFKFHPPTKMAAAPKMTEGNEDERSTEDDRTRRTRPPMPPLGRMNSTLMLSWLDVLGNRMTFGAAVESTFDLRQASSNPKIAVAALRWSKPGPTRMASEQTRACVLRVCNL